VKRSNLAFSEEIATVENDLAMTDAIDTCNGYRWIWEIVDFLINSAHLHRLSFHLVLPDKHDNPFK
jgi:hypothetical protein